MTANQDLARRLTLVAQALDDLGFASAGVVRQGARALAMLEPDEPEPGTCALCGEALVQPKTGRRRKFCSDRCRRTNHERNGKVAP